MSRTISGVTLTIGQLKLALIESLAFNEQNQTPEIIQIIKAALGDRYNLDKVIVHFDTKMPTRITSAWASLLPEGEMSSNTVPFLL